MGIPLELWIVKGLSYIASALGKPLYSDKVIEDTFRIDFTIVCIEFDLAMEFSDYFDLIMLNGGTLVVNEE